MSNAVPYYRMMEPRTRHHTSCPEIQMQTLFEDHLHRHGSPGGCIFHRSTIVELGMVVHAYHLSNWEAEEGGSQVQGQHGLHRKMEWEELGHHFVNL
jgi:hypothetical protein